MNQISTPVEYVNFKKTPPLNEYPYEGAPSPRARLLNERPGCSFEKILRRTYFF